MTSIGLERAGVRLRWFDFIEGPLLIISLPDGWGRPVTAASSRSSHARGSLRLRKRRGQASWLNQNLRGSSGDGDQTHAGQIAAQVAEVCRGDAVITMLADDEAVADVVPGKNGVTAGPAGGALHVSSNTISAHSRTKSVRGRASVLSRR
jgi:hypothetical protein